MGTIDITGRIEEYENGKVFACDCGQDFGLPLQQRSVVCPTCQAKLVDHKYSEREGRSRDSGQSTIDDWL